MQSAKYSRTYHYPFSPGTSSDDRINHDYWCDIQQIQNIVHTEKLDGENNCLSRYGVFARSHAAPTTSPWTADLRTLWQLIKNQLGDIEIFLENLYGVHSIVYGNLESYYYVFAVRDGQQWLSWEEVKFYAAMLDMPTVPEIAIVPALADKKEYEQNILRTVQGSSALLSMDAATGSPCSMEGIVSRNADAFATDAFVHNVFKWVRKGHVQTDEHWTRNWKRAKLKWEGGNYVDTDQ